MLASIRPVMVLALSCVQSQTRLQLSTYLSISELPQHNLLPHSSRSTSSMDFPLSRSRYLNEAAERRRHIQGGTEPVPRGEQDSLVIAQYRAHIGCMQHMLCHLVNTQEVGRRLLP